MRTATAYPYKALKIMEKKGIGISNTHHKDEHS